MIVARLIFIDRTRLLYAIEGIIFRFFRGVHVDGGENLNVQQRTEREFYWLERRTGQANANRG